MFNHDATTDRSTVHKEVAPYIFSCWIGRGGPRSPDLTQLNFFLWGYVKYEVYATRDGVRDLRILRQWIIESVESIPEDMF